jgi:hypothetical protein
MQPLMFPLPELGNKGKGEAEVNEKRSPEWKAKK